MYFKSYPADFHVRECQKLKHQSYLINKVSLNCPTSSSRALSMQRHDYFMAPVWHQASDLNPIMNLYKKEKLSFCS